MKIFPAIDLYEGKAVRLYKGDYNQMTVYSDNPIQIAQSFANQGARFMHVVDLEGARTGLTPNLGTIKKIRQETGLFIQVGGGIRNEEIIKTYIGAGIDRVILGTVAVTDGAFLERMVKKYGDRIAVGVDVKDGLVAIRGWTEKSELNAFDFIDRLCKIGVKTVIVTDISKDGVMQGANYTLYKTIKERFDIDVIASGGVSDIEGVKILTKAGLYGAIVGKAYYTGAISLKDAIEVANDN